LKKFIESFFKNNKSNTINASNSVKYPNIYQNMFEDKYDKTNQTFHYTCHIMPKHVTSWQYSSSSHSTKAT